MLDKRIKESVILVDASDTEVMFLWQKFHTQLTWESDSFGFTHAINPGKKRPTNLCFQFAKINGQTIAFYEAMSDLVDYKLIRKWLKSNFPNKPTCNACNFHQALQIVYPDGLPKSPVVEEDSCSSRT